MTDDELAEIEEWLHSHLLAEPLLRVSRLIAEVRRLMGENEEHKTRWAYIDERHIRCGSLHMDGTGSYSMVGAIGVGRSSEEAVDNAAVLHGYLAAAKPQE